MSVSTCRVVAGKCSYFPPMCPYTLFPAPAALTGLTRVRRFQQDDAHIFCRPAQVSAEVSACLRMMGEVRMLPRLLRPAGG
jgi:hypothetical protein